MQNQKPQRCQCTINLVLYCLSLATAVVTGELAVQDTRLELGEDNGVDLFNPSLLIHNNLYLAAARSMSKHMIGGTEWWLSEAHLCIGSAAGTKGPILSRSVCSLFEPWRSSHLSYSDCMRPLPVRGEAQPKQFRDAHGIEDPKLFVWPGKGVYATFNRKPRITNDSEPFCKMFGFVQYLITVQHDGAPSSSDPWHLQQPVQLSAGAFAPDLYRKGSKFIKEKNWMPFVFDGGLYFTHSITPHRVFKVNSSGVAVQQWVSSVKALLPPQFLDSGAHMHGGPPIVFINSTSSGIGRPYYLGVMHYFDIPRIHCRAYYHFAYMMEHQPPFRICAVSKELPLPSYNASFHTHAKATVYTRDIKFVSGLHVQGDVVHMSYGAFDSEARLMTVKLKDLEAHFGSSSSFDCSRAKVLSQQHKDAGPRPPDTAPPDNVKEVHRNE